MSNGLRDGGESSERKDEDRVGKRGREEESLQLKRKEGGEGNRLRGDVFTWGNIDTECTRMMCENAPAEIEEHLCLVVVPGVTLDVEHVPPRAIAAFGPPAGRTKRVKKDGPCRSRRIKMGWEG